MSDTEKIDIDYVANLARIQLSQDEKEKFSEQLGDVLKYFEKLNEVDVSDVEPMAHAFDHYNVWRNDDVGEPLAVEEALKNAPSQRQNQIVVPKVVE